MQNIIYLKNNPYPYMLIKEIKLPNGNKINAVSMNRGLQTFVYINKAELEESRNENMANHKRTAI